MTRFALLLLIATSAMATDTAFWKPYEPDAKTFFFANFDQPGAPAGRFGGAHQGPEAAAGNDDMLVSGGISIECWVKLDRLPDERAYAVRRPWTAGTTRGFELFVDPSGAFGVAVQNCLGTRDELIAETARVPVGEWAHLAAVSNSTMYQAIYLNGVEAGRQPLVAGHGLAGDRQKETAPARIVVGGVPGLLDEVRVHTNVNKFWPLSRHPWLDPEGKRALLAAEKVFAPGHEPVLHLPLDGDPSAAVNTADVTVKAAGEYVPGVRGRALRGALDLRGAMATAAEGAVEFWSRPVGVNNWSDQNVNILYNSLFSFYLFNTTSEYRPLTLYCRDREKKLHFAGDTTGTDAQPGDWNHYVFVWGAGKIQWYANGQLAGGTDALFGSDALDGLTFNGRGLFGDVDEVCVYAHALQPVEIANTYWRYVDPTKVHESPRAKLANLRFWHLPSTRELYVLLEPVAPDAAAGPVQVQLKNAAGKTVFRAPATWTTEYQHFELPELPGGEYAINLRLPAGETEPQVFKRQRFAWEGNALGITDEVYPPFTPVVADGPAVQVVGRTCRMNGFGLWDSVVADGHELLAAPLRYVAVADGKELEWQTRARLRGSDSQKAVYQAVAQCPALRLEAASRVELDGMMKVTLRLVPVDGAVPLDRLSLEIPLRAAEVSLMHEAADSIRRCYAGALPAGDGEVWSSLQSFRGDHWLNAFTGYVWLGGPSRGLAWFAANDKGWITAKDMEQPLLRIIRDKDRVMLRVDLVNVPGVVREPGELVFGIQASPTKPVPADYRTKAETLQGVGLSVHPWGGLSCSWKSPWQDRWEVVDKVVEGRNTGRVDRDWFVAFAEKYQPLKVHGVKDWVGDVTRFAGLTKPLTNPDPVYFEEMRVLPFIPEYHVYQDEWSLVRLPDKNYATVDVYDSGGREVNPGARTNFCRSYQDYALALENEWMKRGVSMYWDNTYVKIATNPWTSDAYVVADGRVQPATTLWNQREYMRRTWNLMNHWRRQPGVPRPLEFVAHMTNANLLPLFTWSTCNYDIEMSQGLYANQFPDAYEAGEPYAPAFLLTESTGLQVGAYPYIVHSLFAGQAKFPGEALGWAPADLETGRREWGMRTVHEIIRGGPQSGGLPAGDLEKALYSFGYGTDRVAVWRYWDDTPAFTIDNPDVKAILVTRPADRAMFLVVQSWTKEAAAARIALDPAVIGFGPGPHLHNAFHNTHAEQAGNVVAVDLPLPYETAILRLDDAAPAANVLFADDFNGGMNPGWDYVSHFATLSDGALRLGANESAWRGNPRLFEWLDLPDIRAGELRFTCRIERLPEARTEVVTANFPAAGIAWSKHGLTHSYVPESSLAVRLDAEPAKGVFSLHLRRRDDRQWQDLGNADLGALDTEAHTVRIVLAAGAVRVLVDGEEALAVPESPVAVANSFGLVTCREPDKAFGALYLDDIAVLGTDIDPAPLAARRAQALARANEARAAGGDELRALAVGTWGPRHGPAYHKLAYFRRPTADAGELLAHFRAADNPRVRLALLTLLRQLPAREREHVASMTAIGQPAERVPEFKAARQQVVAALEALGTPADDALAAAVAETLKTFKTE